MRRPMRPMGHLIDAGLGADVTWVQFFEMSVAHRSPALAAVKKSSGEACDDHRALDGEANICGCTTALRIWLASAVEGMAEPVIVEPGHSANTYFDQFFTLACRPFPYDCRLQRAVSML